MTKRPSIAYCVRCAHAPATTTVPALNGSKDAMCQRCHDDVTTIHNGEVLTWHSNIDGVETEYHGLKLTAYWLGPDDLDAYWRMDGSAARNGLQYGWNVSPMVASGVATSLNEAKGAALYAASIVA